MTAQLRGGPAEGAYFIRRAPLFLRAVIDQDGVTDVLDQLDDEPKPEEKVSVYHRIGDAGTVHINRGRNGSGFYALAAYEHLPDVDGETLRDFESWSAWAIEHASEPAAEEATDAS